MARKFRGILIAGSLVAFAAPAGAQSFSDHYTFLKAVRDRDGEKVTSLVSAPGSILVNAKERGTGEGALHIVARDRDLTWLAYLLGKGARADLQNEEGTTALAIAAQIGWLEGAELLLSRGASVDLANRKGETPLMFAVQARNVPMVRMLMARGANPKKQDNIAGYSALDHARRDPRAAAVVKVLEDTSAPAKPAMGPGL